MHTILWRREARYAAARALCGLALSLACGSAASAAPAFTGLGHLPGAVTSRATALSADGSVVVGLGYFANASQGGFRWTAAGGLEPVLGLPQSTLAYALSGDGRVVGGYTESLIDAKAYTWTEAGGATLLFARGTLWAASADGSAFAGDAMDGGTHQHHAVRWSAADGSRSLEPHGVVLGYSRAFGIDATGTVLVGDAVLPGFNSTRAFRWDAANGMVNIGSTDPAVGSSRADAISADGGTIVGTAMPGGIGNTVAFRWTAAGGLQYLDFYTASSEAFAVSADGTTIVGTRNGDAFVWRAGTGLVSIRALLGDLAAGWTLTEARAVSADGSVVAGWGTNPQGQTEAWRAELPAIVLGVAPGAGGDAGLALSAFPNPAHGTVFVRARGAAPEASVLDVSGRLVRTLDGGVVDAGTTTWAWDGRDADGRAAPAGLYLVRVRAGGETRVGRVLRVR